MAPKSNPATEFSEYLTRVLNGKKLKGITRWKKNWAGKKGETADVAGLGPTGKREYWSRLSDCEKTLHPMWSRFGIG
jgi:hypothetical protein